MSIEGGSSPAFLQGILTQEKELFKKVASAVLDEGLEHRPDPRSRCSRELLEHLIGHTQDLEELLDDGVIHHRNQVPFESVEDGVNQLDSSMSAVIEKLGSISQEQWMEPGKFFVGDAVVAEAPRQNLAWMMFLDAVHHRGQLTTHLRAMGSKVPAIYGPSADDMGPSH